MEGILIFVVLATVFAAIWHLFDSSYVRAVFGSAVTAAVIFQIAAYLKLGYLDPFFPIVLVVTSILGVVISSIIGVPFRARRNKLES